jgi:predicted N-acetyltransferase YhbS
MSLIREERPEDAEAVGAILVTAFGREAEARLVERLLRRRPLLTRTLKSLRNANALNAVRPSP